jgi:meso-butanediol dehydrogenase/(S,S)-butanediol dehydrogenase/diacetyl reductase
MCEDQEMRRFEDRVVLISGTGGRQGRVAAMAFAKEGARVLGCDIDAERSAETTRAVQEAGGEMMSLEPIDLADPAEAQHWVETAIAQWGRVDVLYNNAAGVGFAPFDNATIDHWDYTLRNELTIGYAAARAVWPHFVRQGKGVILSVASIAGHLELAAFPCVAHGVANAGILAMARMLAAAGAPHGIRSVSISPGLVSLGATPASYVSPIPPGTEPLWKPAAMGRPAEPIEVVNTAMFLASDDASYITGTDIAVDGGMSGIIWRN